MNVNRSRILRKIAEVAVLCYGHTDGAVSMAENIYHNLPEWGNDVLLDLDPEYEARSQSLAEEIIEIMRGM